MRSFIHWVHDRPEFIRVCISAAIGTVLAWVTYELVYVLNPFEPRATSSWVISFAIGIVRQHHLHRTLSFPGTTEPYKQTLSRDVVASVAVFLASTILNFFLTEMAQINHRIAWGICLSGVAAFDFILMKFFVFRVRGRPLSTKPRRGAVND